jgi:hypothetical protein
LPVFVSQARDLPAHFPEVYNPGLSDAAWILVGVYGQAFVPRPDGCQAPNPMNTLVYDCADWTPWAQLGVSAFIWAIALLGVWHWQRSPMKLAMTTTFAIGVPLLTFAISRWTPIYLGRTLLWPTPLLMILIAAGLLSVHRRVLRFSLLGLVVGIQLYGTINYYRDFEKDSWVDAASYLAARASRSSDIVLLYPRETITTPFLHYFHDEMPMFPQEGISPEDILQGGQLPETVFSFDRIWLVSTADDMPEAREFVRSRLAGTMSEAEYIHLEGAKQIALFRRTDSRPR